MQGGQCENAPGPVQADGRARDRRVWLLRAAPFHNRSRMGDVARNEIANGLQNDPSFTPPAA